MASAPAVSRPLGESDRSEPPPSLSASIQAPSIQDPSTQSAAESLDRVTRKSLDVWMLAGVVIAIAGTIAGIKSTGLNLVYFFQPAGALIVLGGTFGVALIATPRHSFRHSVQRVMGILRSETSNPQALIEEIVSYSKLVRMKGLTSIDRRIDGTSHEFLRDTLKLAMVVDNREELQTVLETKIRLRERQGETDAKVLEVAGGFAPTIGVLGTVIGLIDMLSHFSDLSAVAVGIGTAFVSTVYGLTLANLVLLPAAHRIRASVAATFELEEMIVEGGLCLFDGVHHSLVRERLNNFLRGEAGR
jgi:chemotaxis protein MotA